MGIGHGHGWIGDTTMADATLDRLLQQCQRIELQEPSRRVLQRVVSCIKAKV
ncbi:ATP-binding protein [Roseateles sp. GG27B]